MKEDETRSAVREFILNEFLAGADPDELTDDLPLISGGILNSLSTIRLVAFLEEELDVEVEAHEMGTEYFDSVNHIVSLVTGKLSAKG